MKTPSWKRGVGLALTPFLAVASCTESPESSDLVEFPQSLHQDDSNHREVVVRRTEYGGDLYALYRLCTCGHGVAFESNASRDDPEPWNAGHSTSHFAVPAGLALDLLQQADDLIDSIGEGSALSIGAWTDLTSEEVSVFNPDGQRNVRSYWHGASSLSNEEIRQCRQVILEVEPDYSSARLEQLMAVTAFTVALREGIMGKSQ